MVDAQRALGAEPWPAAATVRVRMGLHTGEGVLDAEGLYVGPDVHRAARVAAAGHGGQVVLSGTTASAVEAALPEGVSLRALGEHRLKDLKPERLWDVAIAGLRSDFPPIRSLDARPNNLPTQLTAFVGRERELDEARELLLRSRLLTLTGPGGTGKTRLSLQLAGNVMEAFPGGIWFVPLANVTDPSLVLATIAHAVGIPETPGRRPLDALADALAGKAVLLVLDNLEQLVDAAADIADLLRTLPQLTIVGSSRAVLRISGEQEYAVGGLGVPPDPSRLSPLERERLSDAERRRDPEALARYAAVRLFVTRATSVRPDFALTADNADAVAGICARLGGMPLAIELAAARVRSLPPAAILARLGHQLDLLASGSRDLPERQRSLRGAISWSHDLLDEPCRRLLERLAVFVGGCRLEDAEVVGGPAEELGQDVLDGLGSLVDQSLLRVEAPDDEPRYRMLEPIREFALERLETSGQAEAIRDRHASRFLEIAENAAPHLTSDLQRHWLDRLEADLDNLRAALDHATASVETETALRFVAALWRFWQIRGYLLEGIGRAKAVVAMPGTEAYPAPRLAALEALGGLAWWVADYETCRDELRAGAGRCGGRTATPRASPRRSTTCRSRCCSGRMRSRAPARCWRRRRTSSCSWVMPTARRERGGVSRTRRTGARTWSPAARPRSGRRRISGSAGCASTSAGRCTRWASSPPRPVMRSRRSGTSGRPSTCSPTSTTCPGSRCRSTGSRPRRTWAATSSTRRGSPARSHAWSASAAPASTPRTGRWSPSSRSACATTRPRRLRGPREPRATCRTSSSWRGPGRR